MQYDIQEISLLCRYCKCGSPRLYKYRLSHNAVALQLCSCFCRRQKTEVTIFIPFFPRRVNFGEGLCPCMLLRTSSSVTRCYFKVSLCILGVNRRAFMKWVLVELQTVRAANGSVYLFFFFAARLSLSYLTLTFCYKYCLGIKEQLWDYI